MVKLLLFVAIGVFLGLLSAFDSFGNINGKYSPLSVSTLIIKSDDNYFSQLIVTYQDQVNGYINRIDTLLNKGGSFIFKINLTSPIIINVKGNGVFSQLYLIPSKVLRLKVSVNTGFSILGDKNIENEYFIESSREKQKHIPKIFSAYDMRDFDAYSVDVNKYISNQEKILDTLRLKYYNVIGQFIDSREKELSYLRLKLFMNYFRQMGPRKIFENEAVIRKFYSIHELDDTSITILSPVDIRLYYEYLLATLMLMDFERGDSTQMLKDGTYPSSIRSAVKYFKGDTRKYLIESSLIVLLGITSHAGLDERASIDSLIERYSKDISNDGLSFIKEKYDLQKMSHSEVLPLTFLLPNYRMNNIAGDVVHLYDLLDNNKIVIDVWATWCSNCIESFPILDRLKNDSLASGTKFVKISIDKNFDIWRNKSKKLNVSDQNSFFIEGEMSSQFCKDMGIYALPRYILLDKNGILVDRELPDPRSREQLFFNKIIGEARR